MRKLQTTDAVHGPSSGRIQQRQGGIQTAPGIQSLRAKRKTLSGWTRVSEVVNPLIVDSSPSHALLWLGYSRRLDEGQTTEQSTGTGARLITSVGICRSGEALLGAQAPGQATFTTVSSTLVA